MLKPQICSICCHRCERSCKSVFTSSSAALCTSHAHGFEQHVWLLQLRSCTCTESFKTVFSPGTQYSTVSFIHRCSVRNAQWTQESRPFTPDFLTLQTEESGLESVGHEDYIRQWLPLSGHLPFPYTVVTELLLSPSSTHSVCTPVHVSTATTVATLPVVHSVALLALSQHDVKPFAPQKKIRHFKKCRVLIFYSQ